MGQVTNFTDRSRTASRRSTCPISIWPIPRRPSRARPRSIHTGGDVGRRSSISRGGESPSGSAAWTSTIRPPAERRSTRPARITSSRSTWACRSSPGPASSSTPSTATRRPIRPRARRRSRTMATFLVTGRLNLSRPTRSTATPPPGWSRRSSPTRRPAPGSSPGGTYVISRGGAAGPARSATSGSAATRPTSRPSSTEVSAQRGRRGRPARRQDQQLLHRRPDQ